MPEHAVRSWAPLLLVSVLAIGPASVAGQRRTGPTTGTEKSDGEPWPKLQVRDVFTRDAARRALDGAAKWLSEPKCQHLFSEFKDAKGVVLDDHLRKLETTPEGYLRLVFFFDGARHPTCRRDGILAFTAVGSRTVYLCNGDFERAWKRDPRLAQTSLIHEMLHSLGLGENPPTPRHITERVQALCWR